MQNGAELSNIECSMDLWKDVSAFKHNYYQALLKDVVVFLFLLRKFLIPLVIYQSQKLKCFSSLFF